MNKKSISIIVPCYNEEEVLIEFYNKVKFCLNEIEGYQSSFIFIDDGSKDKTLNLLQSLSDRDKSVKYISFSRNFGKEAAMLAALEFTDSDCAVIMDSDLQHPPELLIDMVKKYEEGYDQVIARRNRKGDSKAKSIMAKLYYKLVNRMVDVKLADGVGDYRLLSRNAINALVSLKETNRFSKGLFSWVGFKQVYIDYENQSRAAGETKWSFKKLFRYGIDGMLSFNTQPLKICMLIGLVFIVLSLGYLIFLAAEILINGVELPGYFTTISFICMIGGIQILSIGIIGEYVGRIYQETKGRPSYIVSETNMMNEQEDNILKYFNNREKAFDEYQTEYLNKTRRTDGSHIN